MNYKPYAIIALSFGTGKSNKYLAEIVEGISKEFPEAKLILQKEIADYLPTKEEIDKKIEHLHIFSRGILYGRDAGRMSSDIDKEIRELESKREKIKEIGEKVVISDHRQEGKYLDTLEVLSQAKHILQWHCSDKSNEWKDVILVCHDAHLDRAVFIARKLGLNPAQGVVPLRKFPYDPKSRQIWTRNPYFYAIWELVAWMKIWLEMLKDKLGIKKLK